MRKAARHLHPVKICIRCSVGGSLLFLLNACVSHPPGKTGDNLPGADAPVSAATPLPPKHKSPHVIGAETVYVDELPSLPPYDRTAPLSAKADWVHDGTFLGVQRQVEKADGLFTPKVGPKERLPTSRFRIGSYAEFQKKDTNSFSFDPEFDMDIQLPNLEKRLKVFLTTEELGELPGTDPTEEDRRLRLGVRKDLSDLVDVETGIRVKWVPEVFWRLKFARKWSAGSWKVYPSMSGFWESDEGFGTKGSLTWDRWIDRALFRTSSGVRWTEKTDGVEWNQTVMLGYATELLEERKLGRLAGAHDLARGASIRYTVTGHDDADSVLDRHRVGLYYKFPLYRKWLYGIIAPEINFYDERDWESEPGIKIGLDMLFWGIGDR